MLDNRQKKEEEEEEKTKCVATLFVCLFLFRASLKVELKMK